MRWYTTFYCTKLFAPTVLSFIFIILPLLSSLYNGQQESSANKNKLESLNKSLHDINDPEIIEFFLSKKKNYIQMEEKNQKHFGSHFTPQSVEAFSGFNDYMAGEVTSQLTKLFEKADSGTACKSCQKALKLAKASSKVSKKIIPKVIKLLCSSNDKELDEDEDSEKKFLGAVNPIQRMCKFLPWTRQITTIERFEKRSPNGRLLSKFGYSSGSFEDDEDEDIMWDEKYMEENSNDLTEEERQELNNIKRGFRSWIKSKSKNSVKGFSKGKSFTKKIKEKVSKKGSSSERKLEENEREYSTFGNDVANILELMDPDSDDGRFFCYMFMNKVCSMPKFEAPDLSSWWPPKPKNAKEPIPLGETFNVLHLSDVHYQKSYKEGAVGNCVNLMCCKRGSIYLPIGQQGGYFKRLGPMPAPKMGFYRCDTPLSLFDSTMFDVKQKERELVFEEMDKNNGEAQDGFDFALFTGDMVDHDPFEVSYEESISEEEQSFRKFKEYLGGIPVYPVLGNHDTYPYGQVAQESSGYSNLFTWNSDLMANLWEELGWLRKDGGKNTKGKFDEGEEIALQQVREHYGGFSVTTRQGLRIISLNSNFWYMWNLYNYWNTSNPDSSGTLKFLADELLQCEKKGQFAWIIAHVPPGGHDDDALPIPASAFHQIIKRFSPHVITGVFFGHTHQDQFQLIYGGDVLSHPAERSSVQETGETDEVPINVAWISQSITPLTNFNPGWRYYKVDKRTFQIMDSINYYTRLNETFADNLGYTNWEYLYSAREHYDPENKWPKDKPLNAEFWHDVANRILNDGEACQDYTDLSTRLSPYTPVCNSESCQKSTYCYVTSFNPVQVQRCKKYYGLKTPASYQKYFDDLITDREWRFSN